jgi:hypothetical protein
VLEVVSKALAPRCVFQSIQKLSETLPPNPQGKLDQESLDIHTDEQSDPPAVQPVDDAGTEEFSSPGNR